MDKEIEQIMTCDFDLVLKELQSAQPATQLAASQSYRGAIHARPGVVTAIMEDGLAEVVTNERYATGSAVGIRDHWRCVDDGCPNKPMTCLIRRLESRQIDRGEEHYPVNGNIIANWARAIARGDGTIEHPPEEIWLQVIMSREHSEKKKRQRRRTSPTSLNSSIESLTKAILVGHLVQLKQPQQQCQLQCQHVVSAESGEYSKYKLWKEFNCPRLELHKHTFNFFRYWKTAMPQLDDDVDRVEKVAFVEGGYDINMLMDRRNGMTLET